MSRRTVLAAAIAGVFALPVWAAPYFNDFETDTTANWAVHTSAGTDSFADFYFDYSTVGIPPAPSGSGTRGLKMYANHTNGVFGGMSTSPIGQSFGSEYTVRFDWWANFNGAFPSGGSGSTQLSTFGIGTNGTAVQWPGGAQTSAWFAATGDGNSASDWRAYSSAAGSSYLATSGVYAAGTGTSPDARNNSHPYYAGFGGVSAPAAQTLLYPQQTGTTNVGSAGMEWHVVEIQKHLDGTVTWTVDGLLIATIPSGVTMSGNNLFFGHSDTNTSSSTDVNDVHLLFTLIDNVVVPEPGSLSLIALGVVGLLSRRRHI